MLSKPKDPRPMPGVKPMPGIPKMPKPMPPKPGKEKISEYDQKMKSNAKQKMDMNMRDRMVAPGKENRMSAKQYSLKKSLEKAIKVGGDMRNNTSMAKKKFMK
jgi:hypothetical protein